MPKSNNLPATKSDVRKIVTEVSVGFSETILDGVQGMFYEQNKLNDQKFATKEDLNELKNELKTEISFVRDDIKGLTAELSDTPSKSEFNQLKNKVDRYLTA